MDRQNFLDKVLAYGKQEGFAECEVFYRGGKAFEVLIMEGEVSNYENCREEGLAFRGNIGGRTGYAYTERLTEGAIPYLVEMAKENAALLSPEDMEDLYEGEEAYPELEGVNEELEQLAVSEKIAAAMKMEQAALAGAEEVASLDYCALGTALAEIAIKNTKGLDVSFAKNFATAYVSAIARKGDE
ncbi:MAG: hypothetical protein IJD29_04775, partial [Anaerotignum sp.]|nr:hypothetical protein [Anaerotignum sp.]